jgi:hypothetical protein
MAHVQRIKPEETMLQQDDMSANDVAAGPTQEQRDNIALFGNALRLQELFVALWEAKRRGEPFACSL